MDGNGRWASARALPRLAGHRKGADAVRRTLEAAPACGISVLTLYAFSSDNWRRPAGEVAGILNLLRTYLRRELSNCVRNGVRISVIGRRDRLPGDIIAAIERAEQETRLCQTVHLRIAVDYSSREMLLRAAEKCSTGAAWSREAFAQALGETDHGGAPAPDVDLVIRTGGEQRLSDFLLWECAYAELLFLDRMWPDFSKRDLESAVSFFHSRERRFGGLKPPNLRTAHANIYSQTV